MTGDLLCNGVVVFKVVVFKIGRIPLLIYTGFAIHFIGSNITRSMPLNTALNTPRRRHGIHSTQRIVTWAR